MWVARSSGHGRRDRLIAAKPASKNNLVTDNPIPALAPVINRYFILSGVAPVS